MESEEQTILSLYSQNRDKGLIALAIICGYSDLALKNQFGDLTDNQRELFDLIRRQCPEALAYWLVPSAIKDLKIEFHPDATQESEWPQAEWSYRFRVLRHGGVVPVAKIMMCSQLLLESKDETGSDKLTEVVKEIATQCHLAYDCWDAIMHHILKKEDE